MKNLPAASTNGVQKATTTKTFNNKKYLQTNKKHHYKRVFTELDETEFAVQKANEAQVSNKNATIASREPCTDKNIHSVRSGP